MLQVHDSDEEFLIGSRSNIVVIFWGRTTLDRVRRICQATEQILPRLQSTGFGVVNVILPRRGTSSLPGVDEERERLNALCEPFLLGSASVIEGNGMLATAARAEYAASEKASVTRYPQKLFASIDEAAGWILSLSAARVGDALSVKDLAWDITAARGARI